MNALSQVIARNRILLVCGTGGVGKTTIAAALGVAAARDRRVLVLTIDPAKRLADALGVDLSSPQPTRVWPNAVAGRQSPVASRQEVTGDRRPATGDGFLDALMLDAKRTFDQLIERYAPDPATARTILANPLYQYLSTLIQGSQEYMAMEKVYEVVNAGTYDLLIVDTPPAAHAVDFLIAPTRMIRALTDSMLKLFLQPSMIAGKIGAQLLTRGADLLMSVFGRLAGAELMQEIADLLLSTVSLFGGFRRRATAVHGILRSEQTAFLLVTIPAMDVLADARAFRDEVAAEGLCFGGAIANRMTPPLVTAATLAAASAGAAGDARLAPLLENGRRLLRQIEQEAACVTALRAAFPTGTPLVTVPLRERSITDLEGLRGLAEDLQAPPR